MCRQLLSLNCKGAILLAAGLASLAARADEFLSMPGLWKTEYRASSAGDAHSRVAPIQRTRWLCVDEQASPWDSFAEPPPASANCSRTAFERTSTSLKWTLACRDGDIAAQEGSIVFDSPQHYSGTITVSPRAVHAPIANATQTRVEGKRYAACTSPSD